VLGNASISNAVGAGTLNISINGTANVNCSISKNTTAFAANTATISLTDGTLNMISGTVGTLAAPIDTLNLSDNGTLDTKVQLNVVVGVTNIAAASISAGGKTTININSIAGHDRHRPDSAHQFTSEADLPQPALCWERFPTGYTGASLVDSGLHD